MKVQITGTNLVTGQFAFTDNHERTITVVFFQSVLPAPTLPNDAHLYYVIQEHNIQLRGNSAKAEHTPLAEPYITTKAHLEQTFAKNTILTDEDVAELILNNLSYPILPSKKSIPNSFVDWIDKSLNPKKAQTKKAVDKAEYTRGLEAHKLHYEVFQKDIKWANDEPPTPEQLIDAVHNKFRAYIRPSLYVDFQHWLTYSIKKKLNEILHPIIFKLEINELKAPEIITKIISDKLSIDTSQNDGLYLRFRITTEERELYNLSKYYLYTKKGNQYLSILLEEYIEEEIETVDLAEY